MQRKELLQEPRRLPPSEAGVRPAPPDSTLLDGTRRLSPAPRRPLQLTSEAATFQEWVKKVAEAVQAEVLVKDDADGFKTAADENGLMHQVGKAHVMRNSEERCAELRPELARDANGSLHESGVSPEQAVADCDALVRLMHACQSTPEALAQIEEIHSR